MMKGSDVADQVTAIYAALKAEEDTLRRTMRLRQPNNVRRVRPTGTAATPGNVLVPTAMARAALWFTGEAAPTETECWRRWILEGAMHGCWQFTWPAGWVVTTTDLTGPQGDVDAATLEYDALDQPLDVVPAED